MPFRLYYTRFIFGMAIVLLACLTLTVVTGWQHAASGLSSETLSDNKFNIVATSKLDKTPDSGLSSADESTKGKLLESYGQLPLHFEPNNGQIKSEQVKFSSRGQGYQMFLTPNGATLALRQSTNNTDFGAMSAKARLKQLNREENLNKKTNKQAVVEMQILGANKEAQFSGREELEGKSNYFIGNDQNTWRTDIANYKRVRVAQVYSGISLEYYGNQRQLEYDFIVEPNANPSQIKLNFKGIKNVKVNEIGELVLKTSLGEIKQKKPFVYQTDENGERKEVISSYQVKGKEVGFQLADYDKNKQLIIDPVVLVYSTFLGGSGFDIGVEIAVDNQANAYIRGYTQSLNFPTQGAIQSTYGGGNYDAFVCKLNAAGNQFVYSTFLGGSGTEDGPGAFGSLTVDAVGNAYISGSTNSSNYPTTSGSFQPTFQGGGTDGFITKLSPTGNQLVFSTYFGGNKLDYLRGILVDANNNVYIAGFGDSTNMPVTAGAIQPNLRKIECRTPSANDFQCRDIYLAKLNASGNQPIYFTYFGSSAADFGNKIAIDNSGNLYVTGETTYTTPDQTGSDFPTTPGVVQPNFGGNSDAYVVKINSTATTLMYSTFLGGSFVNGLNTGYDFGGDIAVDSGGNVYITGGTNSSNFPLANPYQANYGGGSFDVFIAKLNATATAFIYSTYLGGSGYDCYPSMAVDNSGNAYVVGETSSPNFPQVQSRQPVLGGGVDAFVTKLNSTGNQILYSTYHGGTNVDNAAGVAVDNAGNAYITGGTHSDQNFPLINPRQPIAGGFFDAFVSKFLDPPTLSYNISGQITGNSTGAGGVIVNLNGGVAGRTTTDANGFYVFNNLPSNSYIIAPVLENASFDNTSRTVTITNSNPPPINFSFTVCPVQLPVTGATVPFAGEFNGSFAVTMSGCPRNVKSNASWLIVTNGETGNGTISYTAQRNFGAARSGTITINGQAFTVTQQPNPNPSFPNSVSGICDTDISFSQSRIIVLYTGGTNNSFMVTIPSSCGAWSAISNKQTWLRVTSSTMGNIGNGQVIFTVDPNPTNEPRSGDIIINGQFFTVIQTPNFPQQYDLNVPSPNSTLFPVGGGQGNFTVNIGGGGRWTTFVPNRRDAGWLRLPDAPGNAGIYLDTVARFTVLANQAATQRTGTIVVGDKAYMVTQGGGQQSNCNHQVSSSSQSLGSGTDSTGSFLVSVGTGCIWSATNSAPSWLEITGGSGVGSGTVSYRTIQPNLSPTARSATITVTVGRTFSVTQNGNQQACSRTINPISQDVSGEGATGMVAVSSIGGCNAFTANSNVGWITATVNNSSQLSYVVQVNNTTAARTGTITVEGQAFTINQAAGSPQRRPKFYDFNGDDKSQISVYRPSNGVWYVLNSQLGFSSTQFGISTDKIVPADYDGDGKTDIAVYRPAQGIWYLLRTAQGFGAFQFGAAEDIPQPADFDGDGRAELVVYRPSNGFWYVLNLVNNQFTATQFGIMTDKPVVGDYDGDGRAEPAVFRPAGGIWYLLRSTQGFTSMQFGLPTDKPAVGDYDGDGRSDIAVYRPSNGVWYLQNSTNGFTATQFGIATDLPVPGDYDGDGRTDLGVYRPAEGTWYLLRSTNGFTSFQFGLPSDKPAPNAFVP